MALVVEEAVVLKMFIHVLLINTPQVLVDHPTVM
jgi:hypothetical protein